MRFNWMRLSVRALMASAVVAVTSSCIPAMTGMSFEMVYVQSAPPPRRVEVVTRRPAPGYMWVEGYWVWQSRSYAWVPGHWQRPPKRHALPFAAGKFGRLAGQTFCNAKFVRQFSDALADFRPPHAPEGQAKGQILCRRQMREKRVVLEHQSDRTFLRRDEYVG